MIVANDSFRFDEPIDLTMLDNCFHTAIESDLEVLEQYLSTGEIQNKEEAFFQNIAKLSAMTESEKNLLGPGVSLDGCVDADSMTNISVEDVVTSDVKMLQNAVNLPPIKSLVNKTHEQMSEALKMIGFGACVPNFTDFAAAASNMSHSNVDMATTTDGTNSRSVVILPQSTNPSTVTDTHGSVKTTDFSVKQELDDDLSSLFFNDSLGISHTNTFVSEIADSQFCSELFASQYTPTTTTTTTCPIVQSDTSECSTLTNNTSTAVDSASNDSADQNRLKFSPHVLPPCRVCGAQATGYHYGANTCEPCKGFYHRMTKKSDINLVCLKQNTCEITAKNRGACSACRYRKCQEAGMCKNNIKTGRYSYSKRSRDIIELQQSIGSKRVKTENDQQSSNAGASQQSFMGEFSSVSSQGELRSPLSLSRSTSVSSGSFSSVSAPQDQTELESDQDSREILNVLQSAITRVELKMQQASYSIPDEQMQAINRFTTQVFSADRAASYASFLKWITLHFKHNFWSTFIKSIPGFKQLPMEDQVELIKHGILDFWVVSRHKRFDTENGIFHGIGGLALNMNHILGTDQTNELMTVVRRLQSLNLGSDECSALCALVILNSEPLNLQNPEAVEELRMNALNALVYALRQNQEKPMTTYSKIISVLTQLRTVFNTLPHEIKMLPPSITPAIFGEIVSSRVNI